MPLSDEERRQLEELEHNLAAEDPRLAQALVSGSVKHTFSARSYFGVAAWLVGVVVLIAGISTQILLIGVGGFLLMGAGAYLLLDKEATLDGSGTHVG